MKISLTELYAQKELLKNKLATKLSKESIYKAINDYHAKRKPRPCGLTVHSVIGCSSRCIYCYIPDMGFSNEYSRPYGLTKEELIFALLSNKYFFPSIKGTYLAFGSVGEPFHPIGINRTISYLEAVSSILNNPIQISTKLQVMSNVIPRFVKLNKYPINVLVTIVSLKYAKILEPDAPSPENRFTTLKTLRKEGFKPVLFFRPILPGINDQEAEEIFEKSKENGAVGVIIGGFRVTERILRNLEKAGMNVSEIKSRIKSRKLNKQTPVYVHDIKMELVKTAREKNLVPFFSACCANTFNIMLITGLRMPCPSLCFLRKRFCTECPVGCKNIRIDIDKDEFTSSFYRLFRVKPKEVNIEQYLIKVQIRNGKSRVLRHRDLIKTLESIYKRKILIS